MEIDEERLLTFIETMNFEQDPEMEALEENQPQTDDPSDHYGYQ